MTNQMQDTLATEPESENIVGGHYRLIKSLGCGGMGTIFYGVHTLTDQPVAVKVLHPTLCDDPIVRSRFLSEARTLACLEHPNIVQWKNSIEENGQLYLIMQFVDGENVEKRLENRGKLPLDEVVPLMIQALAGLIYVHSKNIIHRDIKPSNILIQPNGEVKLADFGIAKFSGMPKHTQTGMTIGTYQYMSPEQILGKELDIRSDIYSMGITLFEMVTGKPPFEGETEFDICKHHLETALPSIKRYDPRLPSRLNKILRKATAKRAQDRYQTAADFMNDLASSFREHTQGLPTPWGRFQPPTEEPKGCLRTTLWFGFWFTLLALGGYYVYFYVWDASETIPPHQRSVPSRTTPSPRPSPRSALQRTVPTRMVESRTATQTAVTSPDPVRPTPDRIQTNQTSVQTLAPPHARVTVPLRSVLPPGFTGWLLEESFEHNQQGWPTGEYSGAQIQWETGRYLVQTSPEGQNQIPLCPSRLSEQKDPISVLLEAEVQRPDKAGHAVFGVNLFNHPQDHKALGYYIAIDPPQQKLTITHLGQTDWVYLHPWTTSLELHRQGSNLLQITSQHKQLVVHINGKSIVRVPATIYTQGRICLFVQQGGANILFRKFSLAHATK